MALHRRYKTWLYFSVASNFIAAFFLLFRDSPLQTSEPFADKRSQDSIAYPINGIFLDPRPIETASCDNEVEFFRFHDPTAYKFNASQSYLRPTNTLFPELSHVKVSVESKRKMEDVIRKGLNLEPYITERGEKGWIENGIVFRPWRKPDPSTEHKTHPSPYFSEYEAYVPFNETLFFEGQVPNSQYKKDNKIILWHTPTRYTQPKPDLQPLTACPEFPCRITTSEEYTKASAAMIFTAQRIESSPPERTADQVFVLHNHEPPFQNGMWKNQFRKDEWKKEFNWTMTYRMDSDFVVPYGIVRRRPEPMVKKNYTDIISKKKKKVAWLVSNCKSSSRRDKYVKDLQKYIDVDIYGECGTFKCPHENDDTCSELITTNYKFYLSLESSFCVDYITEKLFHYLTMDTIVVARGTDQFFQHVPSEIFINTADFPSPAELAKRLILLDQNDDAYKHMLMEKDKYMSLVEGFPVRKSDGYIRFMAYRFESISICLICQKVWNLDKYKKSIPDIHEWFSRRHCHKPISDLR